MRGDFESCASNVWDWPKLAPDQDQTRFRPGTTDCLPEDQWPQIQQTNPTDSNRQIPVIPTDKYQ